MLRARHWEPCIRKRITVAAFSLAWLGALGVTLLMVAPFVLALAFGVGRLTEPILRLEAAGLIGGYGAPLFSSGFAIVMSAIWFQGGRLRRAWLAVLLPYGAGAAELWWMMTAGR